MTIEAMKLALDALEKNATNPITDPEQAEIEDKAITALRTAIEQAEKQEPVAWKWHQAPVRTSWGHDMVVADLAIDKDNTVSVYCERDQTAKVEAMFTPPAAERNKLAAWMMARGYATGHGDSIEDLLQELDWQIAENWTRGMVNGVEAEREACAAIARQWDVDHPASNYGGCIANLIEARGQT